MRAVFVYDPTPGPVMNHLPKVLLSWSSGKDSAWALHLLRQQKAVQVVGLLTTVNQVYDRVAMHAVRTQLVCAQAEAVGVPLWQIPIPSPCSDFEYEVVMLQATRHALRQGIAAIAYGDLFLEDVRRYREEQMRDTGLKTLFPLWGLSTAELSRTMVAAGVKAHLTCVDPKQIPAAFAGRAYDNALLDELPASADPCGERGEFHTFVHDGPMFSQPIPVVAGEIVERDGFVFADLLPN